MIKLNPPANPNYAAVVVKLNAVVPLTGCDNIVGAPVLGFQAIVDKNYKAGDIGIVFTAETQLSEEFARNNNLHRNAEKNASPDVVGYLDDNRRVRALKLRGHRSDALFLPLTSLGYTGVAHELQVGDTFDTLNGFPICQKYQKPQTAGARRLPAMLPTVARTDTKYLPEHYDTSRYRGNEHKIPDSAEVVVTQKLHGTSVRIGHTLIRRSGIGWRERVAARWLKVPVREWEYGSVVGSRKVIKDVDTTDIWTEHGKRLEGLIPQGYVVYGELIGWTPDGSPIQKNYTYDIPERTSELYVYRVAYVNPQGVTADLAWSQVEEFCAARGLKTVPVLHRGKHAYIDVDSLIDRRLHDLGYKNAVPLSGSKKLVDEGVCIRMDGLIPTVLKAKSPVFLQHETKMLDDDSAVDIEA